MTSHDKNRALDILNILRRSRDVEGLRRFAASDLLQQARDHHLSFAVVAGLHQYARCRAWSLYYRQTGQGRLARREAALAGHQVRQLRTM